MVASLSEALMGDLRVEKANCVLLEIADQNGINLRTSRKAIFHFVLKGAGVFRIAGSAEEESLSPGDFILLLFGDGHSIVAAGGRLQEVTISDDLHLQDYPQTRRIGEGEACLKLLSGTLQFAYISPSAFANRAFPNYWLVRGIDRAATGVQSLLGNPDQIEAACHGLGGTALVTALANLQVVHAFRNNYNEVWQTHPVDIRAPYARRIAAAVHAVHTHPEKHWSVAALGKEVGLSRSTFAALFRSSFGTTPIAYITLVRMERAAELLEVQSMPLREVANRVGYRVESSFARAFRQHYGLSPGAYAAGRRNPKHPR